MPRRAVLPEHREQFERAMRAAATDGRFIATFDGTRPTAETLDALRAAGFTPGALLTHTVVGTVGPGVSILDLSDIPGVYSVGPDRTVTIGGR